MKRRRARRSSKRSYRRRKAAYMKGRRNEQQVELALQLLRQQGSIDSYQMFGPWSKEDMNGIDAKLVTRGGVEISFQIKSSNRGMRRHFKMHPNIPCISTQGYRSIREIAMLIRDEFFL